MWKVHVEDLITRHTKVNWWKDKILEYPGNTRRNFGVQIKETRAIS